MKTLSPEPRLQIIETVCSPLFVYPLPSSLSAFGDGLFKPPCVVVTLNHVHAYATKSFSTSLSLHVSIRSTLSQRFSHQKKDDRVSSHHLSCTDSENICRGALKLVWRHFLWTLLKLRTEELHSSKCYSPWCFDESAHTSLQNPPQVVSWVEILMIHFHPHSMSPRALCGNICIHYVPPLICPDCSFY